MVGPFCWRGWNLAPTYIGFDSRSRVAQGCDPYNCFALFLRARVEPRPYVLGIPLGLRADMESAPTFYIIVDIVLNELVMLVRPIITNGPIR